MTTARMDLVVTLLVAPSLLISYVEYIVEFKEMSVTTGSH